MRNKSNVPGPAGRAHPHRGGSVAVVVPAEENRVGSGKRHLTHSRQKAWIYLPLCACYKVISFSGPQFSHPALNTTLSPKNHLVVRISQDHRCGSLWNSGKPTESILTSKCKMECSATSWIFWEGRKDLCKFRDLMFLFRVDYPQMSYFLNLSIFSTKILESRTTCIPTSQAPFSSVTAGLGGPDGSFVCCFLFICHVAVPVLPHK